MLAAMSQHNSKVHNLFLCTSKNAGCIQLKDHCRSMQSNSSLPSMSFSSIAKVHNAQETYVLNGQCIGETRQV